MPSGLNPGVHARWLTRSAPEPVRIDIAGFIGIAERGPTDRPVAIEGWPQFLRTFGDFRANAFLAYAVRGFFDNGGRRCHVARVVAPAIETQTSGPQALDGAWSRLVNTVGVRAGALATLEQVSTTAASGAQPADRRSSVVLDVAGFASGERAVLRQTGKAPVTQIVASADAPTLTLRWSSEIPLEIDLTLPFTIEAVARDVRLVAGVVGDVVTWTRPLDPRFDMSKPIKIGLGGASASAILWDEHGAPLIEIEAASPGRWGDTLSVRVTTSLSAEIATRTRITPDPADRLTLTRVTGLAAGATVEIVQDGVAAVRNRLIAVDPAASQVALATPLIGFDLAGAAAGTKPIRLRRLSFALSVRENGRLIEQFADLDLPTLAEPKASPVNIRSELIRIARAAGAPDAWLDPGSPLLDYGEARLWGGRDGIAMLRPRDFTGSADAPERLGLRLFEIDDEPAALAAPDILLPPTLARETVPPEPVPLDPCELCPPPVIAAAPPPFTVIVEAAPEFSPDDILDVQRGMIEHCEERGDRIAVIDPPPGRDFDLPALFDWRQRFDSSYAATYFPWVSVADPIARPPDLLRTVPPSGHALGGYAAADADAGHDAPANRPLGWAFGLPRDCDEETHALLNERGVNAILARSARGIRVMGARTLSSAADWKQLTVRRLLLRLKRMLARELQWVVFEPAGPALEADVIASVEGMLETEWQARRLAGSSAEEAFFVRVLRSQDDTDAGRFIVEIGVASVVPAEFILLQVVRSMDRVELAEAGVVRGWPQ
ncbi:phage tail sheath C-terminal domain-containing protein [Sphingomonas sp. Root241]|uniref:phage tail sheath C-terminal domain-containing protein n=1 Tax=Sphingomonas sp. Root241 TaxID=1736501 RepID=UPI0007020F98|nr:phage tail sheath C-terminal domain-containing protein [Sphingomonas sp. Root241]KRC81823.1 hypothetical protein ASE13_05530 [Sphingomonas sp. Root241]